MNQRIAVNGCYHCGLPVPEGADFSVQIDGQLQPMCCIGCQAVASAIVDGGLESFYRYRAEASVRPEQQLSPETYTAYDLEEVQGDFVLSLDGARRQAQLLVDGITCAACSWLIEHHLGQLAGVERVQVNVSDHRLSVTFACEQIPLSRIMTELASIGYKPMPATDDAEQQLLRRERRLALMRLGVAGFAMMQVGMVAMALYIGAGSSSGIDSQWQQFFRWVSLAVATPVVLFSARPFFSAAWRSLKKRQLVMDVPVSLAIGGAYSASIWATLTGTGEVYFDSVAMFTFFLLFGRYLEMRARHRNRLAIGNAAQLMPLSANRLNDDGQQLVPVKSLSVGDRVLVKSGETLPCDGRVLAGRSGVIEALLTGEPEPVAKGPGDGVIAGSLNGDSALEIEVTAVGADTQVSAIERLMAEASANKPRQLALADRLSRYFVAAVLLVAALVFALWWQIDPDHALWVVLSVLVVTCPCALALATPAALTAATHWLRRHGLLVTHSHLLESLDRVSTVVFDKTGTLTEGQLSIARTQVLANLSEQQVLEIAAALEFSSSHPIATAFKAIATNLQATDLRHYTAAGIEGTLVATDGKIRYRLGEASFVAELCGADLSPPSGGQWLLLASEYEPLAWFQLADSLRDSAQSMIAALSARGIAVELLSGDKSTQVGAIAEQLGIARWQAGVKPEDKLARIHALQAAGEVVLMVGDGVNDVPVLAGADLSIAMGQATDLAKTRADSVLLSGDLGLIPRALAKAQDCRRVIRQNLAWALGYNLLALPLAACGLVPPWAAAIGMSASSLVVISNALRLNKN